MKQFALAGLMLFCALSAYADEMDAPPGDISSYLNPEINDFNGLSETVWQMLNDAGRTIGFQGGKAQRSYELRQALITRDDILSKTYDFRPLISRQGYLPPVIATSTDLAHITADQIRTAFRTYNIIVPARFVSNPPGWRSYLLLGLSGKRIDAPDAAVRPKNSKEKAVWEEAIRKGWEEGRQSADRALEANFNRLTRDYTGMLRYSTLLQQGIIQAPDIKETQQSVTGTRDELMIGDKVKRIQDPAGFVVDKNRWKPSVRKEPQ
ncbi:type IV secretory system conjugative DNA transfer family protein [Enterobacter hormaechei]|uniref:type IV secretory system conjugative DNA transfer family protein n=1 Tax=Enterobacterales TaxID=91347 RepID=UPI00264D6508|nr:MULTISPECIES: type IV secretory system conjugative DNA transfer family protein [Enterobacterales]EJA1620101.1 type IV secretory system conjugative DNA transfer family protein [Escherichia coli]HAV1785659.1 type IV secretion system DotC family protein [Enterobacter hormaechei subsp. steigerwaltii]MDN8572537.1 type IV secretory system conjugative DNA transfer family protein [Enterobacter hormaechei]MDP8751714.1 type IV secretory system conjugative DNA transfer family protein [Serratia marcesce